MTTERFTHFDLFKMASHTVKLMVIACKFLSSVALSGVVPIVICLVKYINTVVHLTVLLCYIQKHISNICPRHACIHCTTM